MRSMESKYRLALLAIGFTALAFKVAPRFEASPRVQMLAVAVAMLCFGLGLGLSLAVRQ